MLFTRERFTLTRVDGERAESEKKRRSYVSEWSGHVVVKKERVKEKEGER